jgi:hypothetical protein
MQLIYAVRRSGCRSRLQSQSSSSETLLEIRPHPGTAPVSPCSRGTEILRHLGGRGGQAKRGFECLPSTLLGPSEGPLPGEALECRVCSSSPMSASDPEATFSASAFGRQPPPRRHPEPLVSRQAPAPAGLSAPASRIEHKGGGFVDERALAGEEFTRSFWCGCAAAKLKPLLALMRDVLGSTRPCRQLGQCSFLDRPTTHRQVAYLD